MGCGYLLKVPDTRYCSCQISNKQRVPAAGVASPPYKVVLLTAHACHLSLDQPAPSTSIQQPKPYQPFCSEERFAVRMGFIDLQDKPTVHALVDHPSIALPLAFARCSTPHPYNTTRCPAARPPTYRQVSGATATPPAPLFPKHTHTQHAASPPKAGCNGMLCGSTLFAESRHHTRAVWLKAGARLHELPPAIRLCPPGKISLYMLH